MAYYAILAVVLCGLCGFLGYATGRRIGVLDGYTQGREDGFAHAEKVYYTRPKEEQAEKELMVQERNDVGKAPIPLEILLAHGVESTAQLPKHIRDFYGLTDDQTLGELVMNGEEEVDIER